MKRLIVLVFAALFAFYVAWPAFSGYQIHAALEARDTGTLARKIDFPSVRESMRGPVLAHVAERMGSAIQSYGPLAELVGSKIPQDRVESLVDGALAEVVNPEGLARVYATGGDFGGEIQRSILGQIDKMGGFMALFDGGGKAAPGVAADGGDNGGGGGLGGLAGGLELPGGLGAALGVGGGGAASDIIGKVAGKVIGKIDPKKLAEKLFPALSGGAAGNSGGSEESAGGGSGSSFGLGNIKKFGLAGPLGWQLGVAQSVAASEPDVTAQINFQDFDWKVTKLTPNL